MKKCLAFFIIMTITLGVNAQSNHQLLIDSLNSIKQALKANPVSTDLILKKAAIEMEMEDFDKAFYDASKPAFVAPISSAIHLNIKPLTYALYQMVVTERK